MLALFSIGTEKFIVIGLLPNIADYFNIPLGQASQLITYYVFGIAISSPFISLLLRNVNRKHSLVLLMLIFITGNTIAFLAQDYQLLLIGRVIASFTHAPFSGIASSFVSEISDEPKKAQRVAMIFTGLTIANIFGVPLGTIIGMKYGWQSTFQIISILGVITMLMLFISMKFLKINSSNSTKHIDAENVDMVYISECMSHADILDTIIYNGSWDLIPLFSTISTINLYVFTWFIFTYYI
jgi:predicted MFS family arabinose efflux permease